jgi:hypothetical protein
MSLQYATVPHGGTVGYMYVPLPAQPCNACPALAPSQLCLPSWGLGAGPGRSPDRLGCRPAQRSAVARGSLEAAAWLQPNWDRMQACHRGQHAMSTDKMLEPSRDSPDALTGRFPHLWRPCAGRRGARCSQHHMCAGLAPGGRPGGRGAAVVGGADGILHRSCIPWLHVRAGRGLPCLGQLHERAHLPRRSALQRARGFRAYHGVQTFSRLFQVVGATECKGSLDFLISSTLVRYV